MSKVDHDRLLVRTRELHAMGNEYSQSFGLAWLEHRIEQWPEGWGDDLQILIFGDFEPPTEPVRIDSLGIIVFPEKLENTVVSGALCVLKATVKVREKSVPALIDAATRINVFLGACTLVTWGNASIGWWSWVTHDAGGGGYTTLVDESLPKAIEGLLELPQQARVKVQAALYWIREPRNFILEHCRRSDVLRVYSAYWNAFECLVEAVRTIRPQPKLSKAQKQAALNLLVEAQNGKITIDLVQTAYTKIVNPGFVSKATHALQVCFGVEADYYVEQCFRLPEKHNRLYDIRNAINHGDVDAENPTELIRIGARLSKLHIMIWRMFGRMVPFPSPVDSDAQGSTF